MKSKTNVKAVESRSQNKKQIAQNVKIKSSVKAGQEPNPKIITNHNQTQSPSLKIKSGVKAGEEVDFKITVNHNQHLSRSLRIKSDRSARC